MCTTGGLLYVYSFVGLLHRTSRTSVNTTINGFEEFLFSAFLFYGFVWVDLCVHASQIDELPLKDDQIKSQAKRKGQRTPSLISCAINFSYQFIWLENLSN